MLTMFRARPSGEVGSDTTEEIVREGYPYYYKKSNGRMVMARKIPGRRAGKKFSLLGQAFGIDEPKRRSSIDTSRKKKTVRHPPQPQPSYTAPLPQQHFSNFAPPPIPFPPVIPQQPFPGPNLFVPANSGVPPFYPIPGFAPPPAQQPLLWAVKTQTPKPPGIEELLKVESDFLKRAKSKSRKDRDHDHTEIKTTTTTTITKHICASCKRDRSVRYHLDHPIRAGDTPVPEFCRKCRRNAASTSGSSSNDSDDGGSRRRGDGARGRRRERVSRKNDRRKPTSRLHSVEVLSRDERRNNDRSNDHRGEIIVEDEVVQEQTTAPKGQSRRSDNNSRGSTSRSYTRTREGDLADGDSAPKQESNVKINITNRSSSASPPSIDYETREKSVHFSQPARGSNTSRKASQQSIRESYRYVDPLPSASYASLPRSARFSRESLPSMRTRGHAQRRRSERANPERTYDHVTREQEYEPLHRRRSDEDVIVVETEHEPPRSWAESTPHPPPRHRSSDEDFIVVGNMQGFPRSRAESRLHSPARTPVRTRDTYTSSTVDQYGIETEYKWTTSKRSTSSSTLQGFTPSIRQSSASVRRSSDSSDEYNRAYAMAHQNLPDPGPRRRQRSMRNSGGFMDGADTPPQVPDPPTPNGGVWEPRNAPRRPVRGTSSRETGRSTFQSKVPRVPQHQSTPRGYTKPWMNASSIDQHGRRRPKTHQFRARSRSSDSQASSGSMVTQSDSLITPPQSDSQLDSSHSTPLSMVRRTASVHDTTESGNEVESTVTSVTSSSPKTTIGNKLADSSRRRHARSEATNTQAKDKGPTIGLASQKYNDQLGSYASYIEYGEKAITSKGANLSKDGAITDDDDDDDTVILDDATDLTLRTARSKAAINERINARRVSFAEDLEFEPTPEQYRGNSWRTNNNTNGEQSWGGNTNADNSWGTNTNANDFWTTNSVTESDLPEVGGYSGPPSANASNWDLNDGTNTNGFDYKNGFASTPTPKNKFKNATATSTGSDGNKDDGDSDRGNNNKQQVDDEWGPIPTFSSLNI
ncbi:hypothetical protein SBOR_1005 [Sclerotinia borealis F-4128]|uniref:Stc1 domain-containing protein n=1 Tax=Sclerotinia borealis (strain F-4128) TaxID=1432307 RepID=W9CVR1_SCLBF|nr:hypothetical protein SBOR_1005 [Sclerotinia borealis F-4128]